MISSDPVRQSPIYLSDGELIKSPIPKDSHLLSIAEIVSLSEQTTFGHLRGNPPFLYALIVPSMKTENGEIYS